MTACAFAAASPWAAAFPYTDRYEAWVANRGFPIGAWHSSENPHPKLTASRRIGRYRAAGLNQFVAVDAFRNDGNLQQAATVGLEAQLIATTGSSYQQNILHARSIGVGPTAISVFDEPGNAAIAEVAARIDWAQQQTQVGVPHADAPLVYANLSALSVDLDSFLTQTTTDILSYDRYPLFLDGSTDPGYFSEMRLVRSKSLQHNVPMWMIQQAWSREFEPGGGQLLRLPSESDMRFQAFSFLAHGGLGINYFVYLFSSFPEAMIDFDRNQPTSVYDAVADMAPELRVLGSSLSLLRPTGDVEFLGQATSEFDGIVPFVSSGSRDLYNVKGAESGLVSYLRDEAGDDYFMVVNLRHGADLDKQQAGDAMKLFFDPGVLAVERLNRLTGQVDVLPTLDNPDGGNRYLEIALEGGTGDLFKYSTGRPFARLSRPEGPCDAPACMALDTFETGGFTLFAGRAEGAGDPAVHETPLSSGRFAGGRRVTELRLEAGQDIRATLSPDSTDLTDDALLITIDPGSSASATVSYMGDTVVNLAADGASAFEVRLDSAPASGTLFAYVEDARTWDYAEVPLAGAGTYTFAFDDLNALSNDVDFTRISVLGFGVRGQATSTPLLYELSGIRMLAAGAPSAAMPEPGTMLLLGFSGLLLETGRRRR